MLNNNFLIRYPDGGKIQCNLFYLLKDLYVKPKFWGLVPISVFCDDKGILSTKGRDDRPIGVIDDSHNYISEFKNNYYLALSGKIHKVTKVGVVYRLNNLPEPVVEGIKLSEKDASEIYKFFDANGINDKRRIVYAHHVEGGSNS